MATNTTQVTPGVLPGLEGLVSPLFQGTMDAFNLPFASYSGQLVAPFSTDQRSAFDRIAGNVNDPRYQSAFNSGINMAQGAGTPSAAYNSAIAGLGSPVNYQTVTSPTVTAGSVNPNMIATGQWGQQALGQYMSPYLQSVVDTTTAELDRNAGKNQAALRAQLAGKGSFGDRSTLALTEQQRNADQVRANTVAQLMQGGYGQAASLFGTDQARALQAAQSNQNAGLQGGIANLNADLTANLNNASNSLGAQRANQSTDLSAQQLYRQGLGQVAGLDLSNRGLGTQAAQVLGSLGAGAQNTNLAGLQALLGSGSLQQQQQQTADNAAYQQFLRQAGYPQQQVNNLASILYGAPRGQTTTTPGASDLQTAAGLGTSLLGILGGTGGFGSNGWLSTLFSADGGRIGYADGGEIDEEDDDGVSAFGPLDDDEIDEDEPQAGAGSVAAGLNAFGEPVGDGGGDAMSPEGGDGEAPGGSLVDRLRLSGYTKADRDRTLAGLRAQPINGSMFANGIDNPLTALGLGILASKSPHLGEALGQGGLAALSRMSSQKKEALASEQLRQKAALAEAKLVQSGIDSDSKAINAAETELEKGKTRKEIAAARIASPTSIMKEAMALGLKEGTPEYNAFIEKARTRPLAQVNVDTANKPFYTELGTLMSKDIGLTRDLAVDAAKTLQSVDTAKGLLDKGIISGAGGDLRLKLAKGLATAGLINGESVANTEAFMADMGRQTLTLVKSLGAGSGISNADREYAERVAGGNINLTEAGIRRILDINEKAARAAIKQHNEKVAPLLNDPNVPAYMKSTLQVPMPEMKAPAKPAEQSKPAASLATPQYREGQRAVNPATGAKLVYRNGQWTAAQ